MYIKSNIGTRSCNSGCGIKAINFRHPECVFSLGLQHVMRVVMLPCSAHFYYMFLHCLLNGTILEIRLLNTKCVFRFSLQLFSNNFFIPRRNEREMIKNAYRSSCKVPAILVRLLNKTWIFSTDFRKIFRYQISWKSVQWETSCSIRTDRQTWRS